MLGSRYNYVIQLREDDLWVRVNFQVLSTEILKRSRAADWATARREWVLIDIYEADEDETCLCGHHPIREICVIKNTLTVAVTEVGNVCVKRFLGIRSDLIFTALRRIKKDATKSLNEDAIVFFHQARVINAWEYGFLQNTKKKWALTRPQMRTRIGINRRIIEIVAKRGLQGQYTDAATIN
jgi:hypothetical protein